jgi:hypothetical protein
MTTPKPLSPAAQAVLDAYETTPGVSPGLAAALRAAADQVVPEEGHTLPIHTPSAEWLRFDERKKIRAEILAIADELEGANG